MDIMESYKNNIKWTKEEINFIIDKFFQEQKGYREIAKLMNRNEIQVRKQIALLMSKLVA